MTAVGPVRLRAARPVALPQASGLTTAAARERLAQAGPNLLAPAAGARWYAAFAQNLVNLFALLLWAGAALAAIGGMPQLAIAIVVVILVNAVFSFAQEHRAERAVEALGRVLPQRARVRRDGRQQEVEAQDLVPGDVLLLAPGERISADALLLSEVELRVDMSTLTGESRPVRRHTVVGGGEMGFEAPDRVFAGTHVFSGTAEAVVTATGMATELGRIAGLTQSAEHRESPLELEMQKVTRVVALLSIVVGVTFFAVAGALDMPLSDRFLFAIGVIVANVPEGLLPTVTLSLALATQRMARRNAIVRRLSSVETLGCTTVICTDKTGTLTTNEMTVRRLWTPGGAVEVEGVGYQPEGVLVPSATTGDPETVTELVRGGALCNDATLEHVDGRWRIIGDPTDAVVSAAELVARLVREEVTAGGRHRRRAVRAGARTRAPRPPHSLGEEGFVNIAPGRGADGPHAVGPWHVLQRHRTRLEAGGGRGVSRRVVDPPAPRILFVAAPRGIRGGAGSAPWANY